MNCTCPRHIIVGALIARHRGRGPAAKRTRLLIAEVLAANRERINAVFDYTLAAIEAKVTVRTLSGSQHSICKGTLV